MTAKTLHYAVEDDRLSDDWPVFETRADAEKWIRAQIDDMQWSNSIASDEAKAELIESAIAGIVEKWL